MSDGLDIRPRQHDADRELRRKIIHTLLALLNDLNSDLRYPPVFADELGSEMIKRFAEMIKLVNRIIIENEE